MGDGVPVVFFKLDFKKLVLNKNSDDGLNDFALGNGAKNLINILDFLKTNNPDLGIVEKIEYEPGLDDDSISINSGLTNETNTPQKKILTLPDTGLLTDFFKKNTPIDSNEQLNVLTYPYVLELNSPQTVSDIFQTLKSSTLIERTDIKQGAALIGGKTRKTRRRQRRKGTKTPKRRKKRKT